MISRWVRAQLAPTSDVSIEVNSEAVKRWPNLYVALDRKICSDCNNTWLSELEQAVKPFLAPMLTHERAVSLDRVQRRDLARWAIIKVLTLELALRQQHSQRRPGLGYAPSQVELAWLANRADPPPRSRVWLGAFDAEGQVAASVQSRQLGADVPELAQPGTLSSHLTTLTIGQVLLQVFSVDFVAADAYQLREFDFDPRPPLADALVRLWPAGDTAIQWPGPVYIDRSSLPAVARRPL